jgi:hypothetical protein
MYSTPPSFGRGAASERARFGSQSSTSSKATGPSGSRMHRRSGSGGVRFDKLPATTGSRARCANSSNTAHSACPFLRSVDIAIAAWWRQVDRREAVRSLPCARCLLAADTRDRPTHPLRFTDALRCSIEGHSNDFIGPLPREVEHIPFALFHHGRFRGVLGGAVVTGELGHPLDECPMASRSSQRLLIDATTASSIGCDEVVVCRVVDPPKIRPFSIRNAKAFLLHC